MVPTGTAPPSWQQYLQPAGSLLAGGMQAYGQNSQNNTALDLARQASQFGPFAASGYGGMNGTYSGGQTNLNYGQFNPAYSQFAGLTGSALSNAGAAGRGGLPSNVSGANFMTPSLASAYGMAGNQLNGPAMGTANTAFLGAGDQARQASQGFPGYANSVYQNLTEQAAPWETKQYNDLMESEFGSGRLGSSGGALQTQAFAQGLGTANLQRQLQAAQTADQLQNSSASRAGALGGLGNSLLSNAFGNFSNMGNLGINNLGAQSSLSFLPANLQGAWMGNAGAGVQGGNNIQQGGLNLFNAGLNAQTQNSGALARGGELATSNMLGNARFNNASPWGNLLSGIFGGGSGGGGGGITPYTSLLGKAFGMFGRGNGGSSAADPNNSGDMTNGMYNGGAFGGGAPYFDPSTGGYPGVDFSSPYGAGIPQDANGNPVWDTGLNFNTGGDPSLGPMSFNSAGGEAAPQSGPVDPSVSAGYASNNPFYGPGGGASNTGSAPSNPMSGLFGALGAASNGLNIYNGLQRGGVAGYSSAALNAGSLAAKAGALPSSAGKFLGPVGNMLGLYNALKQGGGASMINGGINAAQLYSAASGASSGGAGAAGAAGGIAGMAGGALLGATMAVGAHQRDFSPNANWWNNVNKGLAAGPGKGNTYGFNGYQGSGSDLTAMKQYMDYMSSVNAVQSYYGANGNYNSANVPGAERQLLASYGLTPGVGGMGSPSSQAAAAIARSTGMPQYAGTSLQHM